MGDLISRQAAIETVKKHYRVDNDLLEVIAYEIEALPSAQLAQDLPNGCTDTISRAAVGDALNRIEISRNARWYEFYHKALTAVETLPSAQPSLYGYDFRNLIVFADAVNKKGISDSEIEDFVRNARAAWEYAWEEFQRTQKEALDSIMRGDHHDEP